MEDELVVLYMTFPHIESARLVVKQLLAEKLIACANITQNVESHYVWEGAIVQESEVVAMCKTTNEKAKLAIVRATDLHEYECPCITAIPISGTHRGYHDWVVGQLNIC